MCENLESVSYIFLIFFIVCVCYSLLTSKHRIQRRWKIQQSLNIPQCGPWLKSGSVSLRFPLACVLYSFSVLVKSIVIDIGSLIIILYECIDFYLISLFYRVFFLFSYLCLVFPSSFSSPIFLVRLFQMTAVNISAGFEYFNHIGVI